jgi:predicted molibdopterin-dependent oxidoreductase YjgC
MAGPVVVLPKAANTQGLVSVGVDPRSIATGMPVYDNPAKKAAKRLWNSNLPVAEAPISLSDALGAPSLQCLYVVGGDPLAGADGDTLARWGRIPLVVYQGTNWNATATAADVVLPMAAFCEAEGARVNLEGKLQNSLPCMKPPGEALPGWAVANALGSQLGVKSRDTLGALRREMADLHTSLRPYADLQEGRGESTLQP